MSQAIDARDGAHTLPLNAAEFRIFLIALLAAGIGLVSGFTAYGLYKLIGLVTNLAFFGRVATGFPHLYHSPAGAWVIVIPAVGGLIIGLMAKYGTDKIRGHGIPEAMEAITVNRSRISPRVAIFKPLSAAIGIGTGGPFGAEGPIIQTGGALGSIVGQIINTTAAERKVLLACGAAAGMAATFNTPIAGVILAIELLLFEFKSRSFIPLVIASTMATTVHFQLIGPGPLFTVGRPHFNIVSGLPFYFVLALICGVVAVAFTKLLYWFEDLFEKLPVDKMWWPAIGALGLGIIGYFFPRVFGVGYDTISDILNARLPLLLLLTIIVFKSLALLVSLGSGTSGGLLAPMFMVGAAIGGAFAIVVNLVFPGVHLDPAAFAVVGMAATFAAAARASFTLIIFAFEITRNYNSVLPLMIVCVVANAVAYYFMRDSTIMTEKLRRRGLHVQQDYEVDVLQEISVGTVMDRQPTTLKADMPLTELAERVARHDPVVTRHQAHPIVDADGKLVGIITRGDVLRSLERHDKPDITVLDAGETDIVVTYPDEVLSTALNRMLASEVGRLLVVDRNDPTHLLGYLGRAPILEARRRRLEEESVRDSGWIRR
ncbi:MAG TPA: chloride channel protein, partial [Gammaproteobacteria bacterium]|nr:chloride channel protein [Gammaproteobacteria bacterium]